MSMPFYVSPEQLMKDRADFARKGIARGRSLVVVQYADGIVFVSENPSQALHKVSEIYDRIAFAAVGRYNEFENLRIAGVRLADMRGYAYDRRDVTGRGLANAYAQTLGTIFSSGGEKPYEVEIFVAEVGDAAADDQIYRLTYDGQVADEHGFAAMGGAAEQADDVPQGPLRRGCRPRRRDPAGRRSARSGRDRDPDPSRRPTSRSPCWTAPGPSSASSAGSRAAQLEQRSSVTAAAPRARSRGAVVPSTRPPPTRPIAPGLGWSRPGWTRAGRDPDRASGRRLSQTPVHAHRARRARRPAGPDGGADRRLDRPERSRRPGRPDPTRSATSLRLRGPADRRAEPSRRRPRWPRRRLVTEAHAWRTGRGGSAAPGCRAAPRLMTWTAGSSGSRTSTASPARSAGSDASRRTRLPATCSARSSPGAAAATCSCATAPGSTSTSAATRSTPPPSATTSSTWSPTTRRGSGSSRACSSTPSGGCTTRASPATSTCSRTTPTRPATPTAATRTTWSAGTASSPSSPTC